MGTKNTHCALFEAFCVWVFYGTYPDQYRPGSKIQAHAETRHGLSTFVYRKWLRFHIKAWRNFLREVRQWNDERERWVPARLNLANSRLCNSDIVMGYFKPWSLSLSLSLSLTHTHTHSLSLCDSLTHTHTHTCTHTYALTHVHTHTHIEHWWVDI